MKIKKQRDEKIYTDENWNCGLGGEGSQRRVTSSGEPSSSSCDHAIPS